MATPTDNVAGTGNVIYLRRPRRTCSACGQYLGADHHGDACTTCVGWDGIIRADSLRHQALGVLAGTRDR